MANQDTSATLSGSLSASADISVEIEVSASLLGSGLISAIEDSQKSQSASFFGSGEMDVFATQDVHLSAINIGGSLSVSVSPKPFFNTEISFYGIGSGSSKYKITCPDTLINFIPQKIISAFCRNKGTSVDIKRYKNDTYPVFAKLSKDGSYDITGFTVKLSVQIGTGSVYTSTGSITDAVNGEVNFALDPALILETGKGTYDIEVNDGTYIYTYERGVFEILEDLTPQVV